MQYFSAYRYVLAQVGAYCLGLDKESFQTRMEKAKKYGFKYCLEQANKIKKASERALAYQSLQMWFEVTHKGRTALPIFLDWCSSGISLISALTRCVIGMESCGVFNIASAGNFYKLMADELNSELGTDFTRGTCKPFTIPFYYGGDKNVKDALGENAEVFHKIYAKLVPGGYEFRAKTIESWNEKAYYYAWTLPNGYEVEIPVLQDPVLQTVDIGEEMSLKCSFKLQGPRPTYLEGKNGELYRNNHTKGNGANIIHSVDAFVLEEMHGMAHMPKARAFEILYKSTITSEATSFGDRFNGWDIPELARIFQAWKDTNYPSIMWFYLLADCEGIQLPPELYSQLVQLANRLPEEEFNIISIHDEFGCLPTHVNDMRRNANTIYANIYRSNMLDYFNKVFKMDITVNPFSQDIYDKLLEVDYLLS